MKFGVYSQEEMIQMHKEILWPTVRVKTDTAWGSGTVVYSKPDSKGVFHTFIVTCHHVVDKNIMLKKKFDQVVGYERKKLVMKPVEVEFFYYENYSICKGTAGSCKADIRAFDSDADIALLELQRKSEGISPIVNLFPKDKIEEVHVGDKSWACGAAKGHEPIITEGMINFLNQEMEEGIEYWMSTAQIIFGNSGGSMFRYSTKRKRFEYIGIPARIAVSLSGFSADAITHMGFFVPISRVYKLLDTTFYQFIYDETETFESCKKKREEYRKANEKLLVSKLGGEAEKPVV